MMARLGDVCDFFSGTGFPNQYQGNTSGEYPFFKVGDISKNVQMGQRTLQYCENYINDETVRMIRGTVIPQGAVVFAKIGEALRLNRRAITPCRCLIDNNVMGLKPIDGVLSTEYFFYFMTALDLQKYCEATTVPSVRKSTLEKVEISVPSMAEQNRIIGVLDKLSAVISLRKQQLAKLDELIKARFVEMFGDPITNSRNLPAKDLIQIVKLQRGYDLPIQNRETSGSIPVYGSNGILGYHSEGKSICGVITGRSGTIGKVYYCKEEFWPLNTTLFSIETYGNDVIYLSYLLSYYALERFYDGTGVPTLNRNIVHRQQIIDVPVSLQTVFSSFAQQIDQQKLTIRQSLDKLEVLKKSLMQEYFEG